MIAQETAEFESLVDSLVKAGAYPDPESRLRLGKSMAKLFNVDSDEVAILTLDPKTTNLVFVIPQKLAAVGSIPLTSATALSARTFREGRPEVMNNFSSMRHASVFEGVPMGRAEGELIQKIMSAPIQEEKKVLGVVQISRKGRSASEAGPDFTQKDLRTLTSLNASLVLFVKLCQA